MMKRKFSRAEAIIIMRAAKAFREDQLLGVTKAKSLNLPEIIPTIPTPPEADTIQCVPFKVTSMLSYVIDFIKKILN